MESRHSRRQRFYLQQRVFRHSVFCHITFLHLFCLPYPVFTHRRLKSPFRHFRLQTAKSSVYPTTTSAFSDTSRSIPNMRALPPTAASNPWPHGCAPGSPAGTLLRLPRCISPLPPLLSGCPGKINDPRSGRSLHTPTRAVGAPNYPTLSTSRTSSR